MTVSSATAKSGPYTGNGSTKVFSYGFRILDAAHLKVTKELVDGTIEAVSSSDYTVTGVGNDSGTVVFTVAPASGQKITILRSVPQTQGTDLVNQAAYYAETVEDALDKLTMIDQQQQEELARSLRAPEGDAATSMVLPAADIRAGKVLEFDGNGNPVAGSFSTEGLSSLSEQIHADRLAAEQAVIDAGAAEMAASGYATSASSSATSAAESVAAITDITLAAAPTVHEFVGDGVTSSFPLSVQDAPLESSFVFLDGVYLRKDGYTISGFNINFVAAPANLAVIEVITGGFTTISTTTIGGVTGLQTALDAKMPLAGGTFSGAVTFPAGSTASPAIKAADGTTGISFPGSGAMVFSKAGVEAMRVASDGSLLVGGNATVTFASGTGLAQFLGGSVAGIAAARFSVDAVAPTLHVAKARNASVGSHGAVLSGDQLFRLAAQGSDGTNWVVGGEIRVEVDGTPGPNDMPGRIVFLVTPDGGSTAQEAMRISQNKLVAFAGAATVAGTLGVTGVLTGSAGATLGGNAVAGVSMNMNGAAGNAKAIQYQTGGLNRFWMGITSTAESGADAGSDWVLSRYSDAGGWIANAIQVTRSTGAISLNGETTIVGHLLGFGFRGERYRYLASQTPGPGAPAYSFDGDDDTGMFWPGANSLGFSTNGVRRLYIDDSLVSLTGGSGFEVINGLTDLTRNGNTPLSVNRGTDDGNLVSWKRGGVQQGTVSIAAGTVSYNPFLGSHTGRLVDGSRPEIPVGTVIETVDALIPQKGDGLNKHVATAVCDTPGSRAVFGVFLSWDDEANQPGQFHVGAVGNFFVRMAAGEEPRIGDYVEAAGGGCARVQADDILRSSTVAKVTSTIKQRTYEDGSFLVTCTLHCG